MNTQIIKEYAKTNSWINQMNNSQGLDGWDNYSGGFHEFANWVVVVGRSRDSDILSESNFESAKETLGGNEKQVRIERFGHWACGWFELLLVNPKSSKHLKMAFDINQSLKEYPVLDENDFFEREQEYYSEFAESAKEDLSKALAKHFKIKRTKSLIELAFELNIECQQYYGDDFCINMYVNREPSQYDIEVLKKSLSQVLQGYTNNEPLMKIARLLESKLN